MNNNNVLPNSTNFLKTLDQFSDRKIRISIIF